MSISAQDMENDEISLWLTPSSRGFDLVGRHTAVSPKASHWRVHATQGTPAGRARTSLCGERAPRTCPDPVGSQRGTADRSVAREASLDKAFSSIDPACPGNHQGKWGWALSGNVPVIHKLSTSQGGQNRCQTRKKG